MPNKFIQFLDPSNKSTFAIVKTHLLGWSLFVVLITLLRSLNPTWSVEFYLYETLISLPSILWFTYTMVPFINYYWLEKRRKWMSAFVWIICLWLSSYLIQISSHFILFRYIYPVSMERVDWFGWKSNLGNLILLVLPYLILAMRCNVRRYIKSEKERAFADNQRLLAELQLLKINLQPHFLFNTLNNIYTMVVLKQDIAAEYILKLSELYRIIVYECKKEVYSLETELQLVENYMELERIRYDDRLTLELHSEDIEEVKEVDVPPLLLFNFIENAFKHGCRGDVEKPFIRVFLSTSEKGLHIRCENSLSCNKESIHKGGLGLENMHQRLTLVYGKKYKFSIDNKCNLFVINLTIPVVQSKFKEKVME